MKRWEDGLATTRSMRVGFDRLLQLRDPQCLRALLTSKMLEVDEAVEMKDPTGGRGVNGEVGGKLEVNGKSEEEILESAV